MSSLGKTIVIKGNGQQNRSSYTGKIPLEGVKEGDRSEVVLQELNKKLEKRNSTEEKVKLVTDKVQWSM